MRPRQAARLSSSIVLSQIVMWFQLAGIRDAMPREEFLVHSQFTTRRAITHQSSVFHTAGPGGREVEVLSDHGGPANWLLNGGADPSRNATHIREDVASKGMHLSPHIC